MRAATGGIVTRSEAVIRERNAGFPRDGWRDAAPVNCRAAAGDGGPPTWAARRGARGRQRRPTEGARAPPMPLLPLLLIPVLGFELAPPPLELAPPSTPREPAPTE